jgi:quercetin dioxygenase-like cupin family protein
VDMSSIGSRWRVLVDTPPNFTCVSVAMYAAQYLEAIFQPGMKSIVHRHGGPEVWYTATGETCLETPQGKLVGRPGQHVIVPGGPRMELTATGTELRRAVVLILYDVTQPASTLVHDWKPKGLCGH